MDESTLRNYFRKVLGVAPGASRKELKLCRDKRAQRWRSDIVSPAIGAFPNPSDGQGAADTAEGRLAITNTAYDCLSNADKFREFQSRLAAGEVFLPDLELIMLSLGEDHVKPVSARVLAKRQAKLQERMDRIIAISTEAVKQAGHDEALKLNQGKTPDADRFYDGVYGAAVSAGNKVCREEIEALSKENIELDEDFKNDLEANVVDQSEIIAHKEYDRLEDRAARSAPTQTMPRIVALGLSLVIMGLVASVCFYGATSQLNPLPAAYEPASTPATPITAPANPNAMPAAPAAGIANSVFNRSTFGAPPVPADGAVGTATTAPPVPVSTGADSAAVPAAVPATVTAAAPIADSATAAAVVETPDPAVVSATPPAPAVDVPLVSNAGFAGLGGSPTATKAGGAAYNAGLEKAMKGDYKGSAADFGTAYSLDQSKEALYNQAMAISLTGQFQQAIPIYSQVLALHPIAQAYYNRALCHQLIGMGAKLGGSKKEMRSQMDMARKGYDMAVKIDPRMRQAYYNRGLTNYMLGDFENAAADFTKAGESAVCSQAATYNKDATNFCLKKSGMPPGQAPMAPNGPVGPAGPGPV